MKYIIALMLLLMPVTSWAMDKKLGATNCFKIGIFDEFSNGISTGLDIITPFSNFVIKADCGSPSTVTTADETGDTVEAEGGGFYYICINDAITNAVEDECSGWVEGEGDHLGLIAKTPVKFKAVGIITSDLKWKPYNIVDQTNESGDQNPTTTSSDTDLTQTLNIVGSPQPIMYFPTIDEDSTQSSNCNIQGIRTVITAYNTTTKVITYITLPAAPDYRCVFRIY